jgi:hypothetical protein
MKRAALVRTEFLVEALMPLFFWGGEFPIFVLRLKRNDMLEAISWVKFLVFIVFLTGAYYLCVLVAYYKAEALELLTRKRGVDKGTKTGKEAGGNVGSPGEPERKATASEAPASGKDKPGGGGDELFQLTQRAIALLRQVIAQGIENKLDRENLLDHIKEVLGDYRQLRKTEYAETINKFLMRVCSSDLCLELGEGELKELWK